MGLSDTIKCFTDDVYENIKQMERREKVQKIIGSAIVHDTVDMNLDIRRIRMEYERMKKEWEQVIDYTDRIVEQYDYESPEREKAVKEGLYIYQRKEMLFKAYADILNNQYRADDIYKKLKTDLKELDIQYDKTLSEQMKLEV